MCSLQLNKFVGSLQPPVRHLLSLSSSFAVQRNRLISFPERDPVQNRYVERLDAIKAMDLPKIEIPEVEIPMATTPVVSKPVSRVTVKAPVVEENYVKANGISVVYSPTVPDRYKRASISQEEIEHIMRGGPE